MKISNEAQKLIDYFSGEGGNQYTDRNKSSIEDGRSASDLIYNIVKMKKIKTICEIGCNTGHNLSRLKDLCDVVCGVDINKKALEEGKKLYPFVKFVEGSSFNLPLYENSFELIFSRGVCIHLHPESILNALNEMKRVSKKFIINIEYGVKDENNLNEEVEWRDNLKLWRVNMEKHWKQVSGIKVKDYFNVPLENDKEEMKICVIEKK